ncbi:ribosome biogenesis GTP-binding protein YihA/YsxC [Novosphingopyxis baekryungensis]|jgi:GTP-binding protein|uniref:ribosome biogenesis GTP-binding protein YihA/YsxC n=1 Tax=Novosphingopyxis baekryungensis TaxID=279369 RepID=UPI0003B71330|nr:ribosome biogenesis GTP-binding protein YihA/YsxC [Novosphingopyxis baekryungensis]
MNAEHNAIFSGKVDFLKSAPKLEFLPDPDAPEIAFAGRSNVGKSSLINALLGRKAIARTSVTPGRTQELNFFNVGDPPLFRIVDMPGYGYAKAPVKTVQRWRYLINDYLRGRQVLARTFLLIDARRGIGPVDLDMMAMLNGAAVSFRTVLTKTDKVKQTERDDVAAKVEAALRKHPAAFPGLILTSSEKAFGIEELRSAVLESIEKQ